MKIGHYITIGKSIDVPNKSMKIYPLLYQGSHAREYKLIEEVQDLVELIDSGRIDTIYIKNKSRYPVFVRAGNIITGATQNRGIKRSVLVFPQTTKKSYKNIEYTKAAEVFCVHQSSPITSGGTFTVNCLMPHKYEALAYSSTNQSGMWGAISTDTTVGDFVSSGPIYGTTWKNDDLFTKTKAIIDKSKDVVTDIIDNNPWILDAVGIAIVDSAGVLSIELYDSQESWAIMCKKILNKYAPDFSMRSGGYTTGNYWKNKEIDIKSLLNSAFKVLAKYSDSLKVDGKRYLAVTYQGNVQDKYEAEITKLNKKVIHFATVRGTKYNHSDLGPLSIQY